MGKNVEGNALAGQQEEDRNTIARQYAKALGINIKQARSELETYRNPKTGKLELPFGFTYVQYGKGIDFVDSGGASEGSGHN